MFFNSLKKEYFFSSGILLFGMVVFNLANIIFYFVAARLYSLETYAELLTLMSLCSIFAMASGAIILLSTDRFSRLKLKKDTKLLESKINTYNFYVISLSIVVFILLLIGAKLFVEKLHFNNYIFYFLVIFSMVLIPPLSLYRGFLQGVKKFNLLSLSLVVEGLLKVIFLLVVVFFSLPASFYLASLFLSMFIVFLFLIWKLKIKFKLPINYSFPKISQQSIYLVISFLILGLCLNIDLIIFRYYFSPESGFFGLSALCAKLLFYFSGAFVGVLYPLVVENSQNRIVHRNLLFGTFLLIIILFIVILLLYYFFGLDLLKIFIPNIPNEYWGYLLKLTLTFFLLAIVNTFVNYFLALKDRAFFPLLVFILIIQVILLTVSITSQEIFFSRLLAAAIIGCIIFLLRFIFLMKRRIKNENFSYSSDV